MLVDFGKALNYKWLFLPPKNLCTLARRRVKSSCSSHVALKQLTVALLIIKSTV
jgi:hypothetical protein